MKKFKVIYADPPWQFKNKHTGGSMTSSAQSKYPVMCLDDIKKLPIQSIADDHCLLIMWYVGSMAKEAIELCEAWGFRLVTTSGFVWNKTNKDGSPFFGMGHYTRAGSESALIGIKGKTGELIKSHSVRQVITAPVGRHSEKPREFRDAIVELCGDVPRIELFSRESVKGWDVWGNECESTIEL